MNLDPQGDKPDVMTEDNRYQEATRQAFEMWVNPEIERRRQTVRLAFTIKD